MKAPLDIRPWRDRDREPVDAMFCRAFRHDPGYQHLFPDHLDEALAFLLPRRLAMRRALSGGGWVAWSQGEPVGGLLAGAAGGHIGLGMWLQHGLGMTPFRLGLAATGRMLVFDRRSGELKRRAQPQRPHLYLDQLAVDPARHGQGIGLRLLRHWLEAEAGGQDVFLQTSSPKNVAWYQRSGFEVTGEEPISEAVTLYGMVRPAP